MANLTTAALALLGGNGPLIAALSMSRPGVAERVRTAWAAGAPGLSAVEDAVDEYLRAERARNRVRADADTAALALAVVGAAHHLLLTSAPGGPDPADRIRGVVAAVLAD